MFCRLCISLVLVICYNFRPAIVANIHDAPNSHLRYICTVESTVPFYPSHSKSNSLYAPKTIDLPRPIFEAAKKGTIKIQYNLYSQYFLFWWKQMNKKFFFYLFTARTGTGFNLSTQQFSWIQYPQLFWRHWIPQTARKPQCKSNFKQTKHNVIPISRWYWNFILPEIAQRFWQ